MTGFRIAHFSDIHVTVPPLEQPLTELFSKRFAGAANYYVGRRRERFGAVTEQVSRLLRAIDDHDVEHVLCTGDLTSMSYAREFEQCAALFGSRLRRPDRHTVLPGNHDRYTTDAVRRGWFEHWFGDLSADGAGWPFRKDLSCGVSIIALDVSRPRLVDSSGWCGPEQRERLRLMLANPDLEDRFVIVALHYGLVLDDGRPDRIQHGLRDWREVTKVLRQARPQLVVHGHLHHAFVVDYEGLVISCAGSATDLRQDGGWSLYEGEVGAPGLTVRRMRWSDTEQAFVEAWSRDVEVPAA